MLARYSLLLLLSCRLGRPAPSLTGVKIVSVHSPVVEPGLGDVLHAELSSSLARRGVGAEGASVELQVWDASTRVIGVEGGHRILIARMEFEILLGGARPRATRLVLERTFAVQSEESAEGANIRKQAFAELARQGAEDAADWILYAPR